MAIFENGMAPITQVAHDEKAVVPRSSFNMSRVTNFNGIIGAIMPFDVLETLPNEDYTITYDVLAMTRNPLVRRLMSGMSIYIHTYYCSNKDLWEGWRNFIDKGRDGKHVSDVPKLYPVYKTTVGYASGDKDSRTPFAPSSFMGLPIAYYDNTKGLYHFEPVPNNGANVQKINNCKDATHDIKWGVNALPFVMYNKIYRDYYANANLLMGNKNWYPDNEDDALILPYDCSQSENGVSVGNWVNCADKDKTLSGLPNDYIDACVPNDDENGKNVRPLLNVLHFRQFKGDYFTSANPFENLLRGDSSALNLDLTANTSLTNIAVTISNALDASDVVEIPGGAWEESTPKTLKIRKTRFQDGTVYNAIEAEDEGWKYNIADALEKLRVLSSANVKQPTANTTISGMTLSKLRKAMVAEQFMRRNATTNGSYKELIGAQFGYTPSDHDRKPIYIGGCKQDISFNTVVNTSGQNIGTGSNGQLGMEASKGISASSGYIGKFHSDDYGFIMSVMTIVPDVYYDNQGLNTMWTRTEQSQQYYPIMNNLDPQAILNKELFISEDKNWNETPFGYADIFEDMKHRNNIICGLGALNKADIYDSANFQKRTMADNAKPALNPKWLSMTPENIDMSPFTVTNEAPFDIMVGCNIDKVSPMPYAPKPMDMGIKY